MQYHAGLGEQWVNTWLKISSLMVSQSTLCLQMRQDAVANEPEIKVIQSIITEMDINDNC